MSTIGNQYLNIVDMIKARDPNGGLADVVKMLSQQNDILQDLVWAECNKGDGMQHTVQTGLPTSIWRKLYQGVPASKSRKKQVVDVTGQLASKSIVDVDVPVPKGATIAQARLMEDQEFIEGMSQDIAEAIFYSNNKTDQDEIYGLTPRYNDLAAENARNIIDAGGSGSSLASIWLVGHGRGGTFGIFPENSQGGLQINDRGEQNISDGTNDYTAFQTDFKWNVGLSVRDWRKTGRVANIDLNTVLETAATGPKIISDMIKLANRIINPGSVKLAWYMNSDLLTWLELQALNKSNVWLSYSEVSGQPVVRFRGIPVRRCDALVNTEDRVV